MRSQESFPPKTIDCLEKLLEVSDTQAQKRRIQTVYLRAKYGYDAERIAGIVGLKLQTIRNIHSAYLKRGESSLILSGKGGRRNFYLNGETEKSLIARFQEIYCGSDCVEVSKIHKAYQKEVSRNTALSTTYRMLRRHGWRRYYPHPGFWYRPPGETEKQ